MTMSLHDCGWHCPSSPTPLLQKILSPPRQHNTLYCYQLSFEYMSTNRVLPSVLVHQVPSCTIKASTLVILGRTRERKKIEAVIEQSSKKSAVLQCIDFTRRIQNLCRSKDTKILAPHRGFSLPLSCGFPHNPLFVLFVSLFSFSLCSQQQRNTISKL